MQLEGLACSKAVWNFGMVSLAERLLRSNELAYSLNGGSSSSSLALMPIHQISTPIRHWSIQDVLHKVLPQILF